jgi:hypothetical protein
MMGKKVLRIILIAGLCLAARPAFAAPLQKSEVSPTANWVAHVDLEAFRSSAIGKLVLTELENQGLNQKLQDFAAVFSFNPLRDIRDVTLYGNGQDRSKAVVIVEGQFDTQKILSLVRLNSQYQEIPYKGSTLHRWQQEPKPGQQPGGGQAADQMMYGCICDGNRVVMGSGLDAVQKAVDTIKGQATGTSTGLLNQVPEGRGKVFAQVAATGVGQIVGQDPKAALLKQTESLALTLGETSDKVFGELGLQGQSAETADSMTKLVQGLIAMVQLNGNQPQLAELAKSLNVSQADKTTQIRFEAAPQTVFGFLKTQWEQKPKQGQQQPTTAP